MGKYTAKIYDRIDGAIIWTFEYGDDFDAMMADCNNANPAAIFDVDGTMLGHNFGLFGMSEVDVEK